MDESIPDLPGSKAKIDVASKLYAGTASTQHGKYVAPSADKGVDKAPSIKQPKIRRVKKVTSPIQSSAGNSVADPLDIPLGPPLPAEYVLSMKGSDRRSVDDLNHRRFVSPVRRVVSTSKAPKERSRSVPRCIERSSHLLEPTTAALASRYVAPEVMCCYSFIVLD